MNLSQLLFHDNDTELSRVVYTSRLPMMELLSDWARKALCFVNFRAETSCTLAYYPFLCQNLPSAICLASVLTDPLKDSYRVRRAFLMIEPCAKSLIFQSISAVSTVYS